ncbi:MAG: J domain-containing protein [Candidatus Poribacteria bacterium]
MRATVDHYTALGVSSCATDGQLREAFRRLAKEHHPDKNPNADALTRERFIQVVRAYEVLSDSARRSAYDKDAGIRRSDRPRPTTPEGMAYEGFDLLLAERADEALEMFALFLEKTGTTVVDIDLPKYLDYNDARDCEFLLAEALERSGRWHAAITLYERTITRERRRPYFRKFTVEIHDRLKTLYIRRIRETATEGVWDSTPDEALEPIFALGASRRERAALYKSLAQILLATDHDYTDAARDALVNALELAPKITGVKKLCRALDVAHPLHDDAPPGVMDAV